MAMVTESPDPRLARPRETTREAADHRAAADVDRLRIVLVVPRQCASRALSAAAGRRHPQLADGGADHGCQPLPLLRRLRQHRGRLQPVQRDRRANHRRGGRQEIPTGVVLDHLAVRPELQRELPVRAQIEGLEAASLGRQIVVACVPLAAILCRAFVRQLDVRPSLIKTARDNTHGSERAARRKKDRCSQ